MVKVLTSISKDVEEVQNFLDAVQENDLGGALILVRVAMAVDNLSVTVCEREEN